MVTIQSIYVSNERVKALTVSETVAYLVAKSGESCWVSPVNFFNDVDGSRYIPIAKTTGSDVAEMFPKFL